MTSPEFRSSHFPIPSLYNNNMDLIYQ